MRVDYEEVEQYFNVCKPDAYAQGHNDEIEWLYICKKCGCLVLGNYDNCQLHTIWHKSIEKDLANGPSNHLTT